MALEFFAAKIHTDPAESHELTGSATINYLPSPRRVAPSSTAVDVPRERQDHGRKPGGTEIITTFTLLRRNSTIL